MLGGEGGELAGEFLEGGVGVVDAKIAGLLEGGQRFGDARDGILVGVDVEVVDSVGDELKIGVSEVLRGTMNGRTRALTLSMSSESNMVAVVLCSMCVAKYRRDQLSRWQP